MNHKRQIPFVKHRRKFFMISLAMLAAGIILLLTAGLNLGIDFESGSRIEIGSDQTLTEEEVENAFSEAGKGYEPDDVTLAGENNEMAQARFIGALTQEEIAEIQTYFTEEYGEEPNVSTVSPQVGQELALNALTSVLIASIGIIIYISIRFQFLYGVAAIVALLHDAFFIIVFFSLLQIEVNVPFIAAVLTIVGYSINDTIVTFDRIRENMNKAPRLETFEHLSGVVDMSLNQTLTRSINTVLTVVLAASALFIFGGEAIRSFALALLIGLIAGTYSSIFLAAQIWSVWEWRRLKKKREKGEDEDEEEEHELYPER
ncbi:protein translocase subunit SecF [Alteribacillus sp. HJP-4]|uniref:protein translocase subunit SecF n=1 Tax=Alteribacillus sp. HJP-4 TaxID=2775394 RepID=UPI0035CD0303